MKYVIIAYLTHIKGYTYPYDIYICTSNVDFKNKLRLVRERKRAGFYSKIEIFKRDFSYLLSN